jgi:CheY-like chemotaxis protein
MKPAVAHYSIWKIAQRVVAAEQGLESNMSFTVMIVDDSKLARIVAGKAIAELQPEWSKVEAASAAQALDVLDSAGADITLIDFNMPEKDGLELAAELRVLRPDMPIAIITANIQDEIIARAREVGAAFIAKPVTSEGLSGFLSGAALKLRAKG